MSTEESGSTGAIAGLSAIVEDTIETFTGQHFEVIVAALCTEDGFVISQSNGTGCSVEPDKMASISSTLVSMCSAAVQNIKAGDLRVAIIDSEAANLVFCSTSLLGRSLVLTVAISKSLSLGQTLYLVNRLKKDVEAAS